MSTGALIGLIVAIVVVAAVSYVVWQELRRTRLRRQFGPEYTRLAKQLGSNRKAESELLALQRKASRLSIRSLSPEQQGRFTADWASVQERFVDSPADTVASARRLIARVMRERGYPDAEGRDLIVNLSVHNPRALDDFRKAETISGQAGQTSTEDWRVALLGYRTLFTDLTGAPRRDSRTAGTLSEQGSVARPQVPQQQGVSR
ncbi:MAG TPA: hypothetical protein VKU39_12855 [Streptosporangiaceae bacterium]|nr:hypothetical protein [Streptosporangiaceae bacterium]